MTNWRQGVRHYTMFYQQKLDPKLCLISMSHTRSNMGNGCETHKTCTHRYINITRVLCVCYGLNVGDWICCDHEVSEFKIMYSVYLCDMAAFAFGHFLFQFCEHCLPHNMHTSAHTHSAEECLTINLIGCLVCFVWGTSKEGLALQLIGFSEYTPLLLYTSPLSSYIIPPIPLALFLLLSRIPLLFKVDISLSHNITLHSINTFWRYSDRNKVFFLSETPFMQEESCYLVPRRTSCSTHIPDP